MRRIAIGLLTASGALLLAACSNPPDKEERQESSEFILPSIF